SRPRVAGSGTVLRPMAARLIDHEPLDAPLQRLPPAEDWMQLPFPVHTPENAVGSNPPGPSSTSPVIVNVKASVHVPPVQESAVLTIFEYASALKLKTPFVYRP